MNDIPGTFSNRVKSFFGLPLWRDPRTIAVLWLLFAVIAALTKGGLSGDKLNNYLIFRQVYWHLVDFKSLYAAYPEEYGDVNHYGPVFALVIAPFALLPKFIGLLAWLVALGGCLYGVLLKMPLKRISVMAVFWIVSEEVLAAMQMAQFNIAIAAIVVGAYVAVRKDREWLAALLIVLGMMTKLYGIVGLVSFLFSRHRWRFAGWLAVWGAVMFVAPMLLSSPGYVVEQYGQWFGSLVEKNALNVELGFTHDNTYQNISVMGMVHRVTQAHFSDLYILVPAVLLFLMPLVRVGQWRSYGYQWGVVASALMCIILYSTGSESSGYIIAMTGVALWYVTSPWKRSRVDVWLLVFAIVVASFGTSDLMPSVIRKGLIRPYSLKALPVLIIWLKLIWELTTRDYPVVAKSDNDDPDKSPESAKLEV